VHTHGDKDVVGPVRLERGSPLTVATIGTLVSSPRFDVRSTGTPSLIALHWSRYSIF